MTNGLQFRIVIYGAGSAAEKFLCLNHGRYSVSFLIDRNARTFHGLDVVRLCEGIRRLDGEMIVVATDYEWTYNEIRSLLVEAGFEEKRDFIPISRLDKQLAILYGNCHMIVMEDYLSNVPDFTDRYYIRSYLLVGERQYVKWPTDEELGSCALLITEDVRPENSLGAPGADEMIGKLKAGRSIKMPNLFGRNLFYPQLTDIDFGAKDIHVGPNAIRTNRDLAFIRWVVGWRDENIERIFGSGGVSRTSSRSSGTATSMTRSRLSATSMNRWRRLRKGKRSAM